MRLKEKIRIIDEINAAFIDILAKDKAKEYKKYFNSINKELIANVENLNADKVKQIVNNASININDSALLFMLLSAITTIIFNQRLDRKQRQSLSPIIAIIGIYTITRPKQFANKMVKISKGIRLNGSEKKIGVLIQTFKTENMNVYNRIKAETIKQITKSQYLASKAKGKAMLKEFKTMRENSNSVEYMQKKLAKTFKKVDIDRMLHTELHSQAELAKSIQAESAGWTHKTWKTQGDSRVRTTKWHDQVANKRIPIDSDFRANGLRASYPGDTRLPPSDRIRCRCYLIYDKK